MDDVLRAFIFPRPSDHTCHVRQFATVSAWETECSCGVRSQIFGAYEDALQWARDHGERSIVASPS